LYKHQRKKVVQDVEREEVVVKPREEVEVVEESTQENTIKYLEKNTK
jgi:hypothetical protein